MEWIELNPKEEIRIYHLKDGNKIEISNVTHFNKTETTHRLKDSNGILYIIPQQIFNYIEIHSEDFTI